MLPISNRLPTLPKMGKSLRRQRGVAQLVARPLWERKAVGSSPATPTITASLSRILATDAPVSRYEICGQAAGRYPMDVAYATRRLSQWELAAFVS